ncbi:hypothetical protein PIB30_080263 [Stylosanthes scabra]|uniref:Uncharacterized protein n=1 Tax=Stylosanthes scabra TaxID=79078 RepID=A0ABU6XPF5_9FABA|nr:hypothetical protein [Stylosanthes scabra]
MEEKKINLPRVLKDAVHKVHSGKRQSLALPCLIMKISHSNRIPQCPGDEMFHIPRAARYIPYGDWDEWGIQLKKRKKRSEAVPLNQLPALVPKPPTPRQAPDLGYVVQLLHQVLQGQCRIDRRCQNIQRFLQHTFPDFDISQLDLVTPEDDLLRQNVLKTLWMLRVVRMMTMTQREVWMRRNTHLTVAPPSLRSIQMILLTQLQRIRHPDRPLLPTLFCTADCACL